MKRILYIKYCNYLAEKDNRYVNKNLFITALFNAKVKNLNAPRET